MPTQLNICHIVLSLEIGGLEKVVSTLAIEQIERGYNVNILCLDDIGILGSQLLKKGIEVTCLKRNPGFLDFQTVFKIKKILRQNRIDIIHTHNVEPYIYGIIPTMFFSNIKSIHTQHGLPENFNLLKKYFLKFTGLFLNQFISVSDTAAEYAITNGWISSNKVDVIINGIDTDSFVCNSKNKSIYRKELNIPDDSLVLVTVSRIEYVKDHMSMVKQFLVVTRKTSNVYLIIVGDGSLKNELSEFVNKNNLSTRIIFTGMQTDIKKFLQLADIFIMTSLSEGISISLLEAMSSNLIPIVTPVGGNTQIVENNKCGFFIDIKQQDALYNLINDLKNNIKLSVTISSNAREKVLKNFSKNTMVNNYVAHYERL